MKRRFRIPSIAEGEGLTILEGDVARTIASLVAIPDPEDWVFETAEAGKTMRAHEIAHLVFRFPDSRALFSDEVVVLDDLSEELIIGAQTMQKWSIKLDFVDEKVIYRKTAQRLRI